MQSCACEESNLDLIDATTTSESLSAYMTCSCWAALEIALHGVPIPTPGDSTQVGRYMRRPLTEALVRIGGLGLQQVL